MAFKEHSDPIQDLGIGIEKIIKEDFYNTFPNAYYSIDNALLFYSGKGYLDYVKALLELDADVHYEQDSPLRWAAANGHADVIKVLLDAGADIHADNDYPLRWAMFYAHKEVVKVLLDAGANVNVKDDLPPLRLTSIHDYITINNIIK